MNTALLDKNTPSMHAAASCNRMALEGSLAIYDVAEAKPRLFSAVAAHRRLEVDLSRVEAIDTAGIQLLMLAKIHATALGHEFSLVGHSQAVAEMFELFRLAGYFKTPVETVAANDRSSTALD